MPPRGVIPTTDKEKTDLGLAALALNLVEMINRINLVERAADQSANNQITMVTDINRVHNSMASQINDLVKRVQELEKLIIEDKSKTRITNPLNDEGDYEC